MYSVDLTSSVRIFDINLAFPVPYFFSHLPLLCIIQNGSRTIYQSARPPRRQRPPHSTSPSQPHLNNTKLTNPGIKNHKPPNRHRSPDRHPRNRPLRLRPALLLPRPQWRLRRPRTHVPRPRVLRHSHSPGPQRKQLASRRPRRARSRHPLPQMLPLQNGKVQYLP